MGYIELLTMIYWIIYLLFMKKYILILINTKKVKKLIKFILKISHSLGIKQHVGTDGID